MRLPALLRRRGLALPTAAFVAAQLVVLALAADHYARAPSAILLGWSFVASRASAAVILLVFPVMVSGAAVLHLPTLVSPPPLPPHEEAKRVPSCARRF